MSMLSSFDTHTFLVVGPMHQMLARAETKRRESGRFGPGAMVNPTNNQSGQHKN